ncbi:MAG: hypothetical protein IJS22_03905 [Lachnospiraceae bacterium]|nr:hypothetical protein [Lachnospiraceae bacterium]
MANNSEENKKKKKLLIWILLALLVIAAAAAVTFAVLGGRNGGDTQVSTSEDVTQPSEKPSHSSADTKPAPVSTPYLLWDMEALPDDLIAAGMAYANSNENIFGNVQVRGVDGKGINGSRALGFFQIGAYSGGDMFMISAKAINKEATNWENSEMLWFWVNGTDLNSPSRLDIMINGHYLPVGETYYTIDENGQCAVAGQLLVGWGNTETRARLRLNPGYEGWIGLPLEIFENPSVFTSIQFHIGNSTILPGNTLYLDEFYLTDLYEVPDLPLETLLYSSIEQAEVPALIWDMEELPADLVESGDASNKAATLETARIATSLTSAAGKGFRGSAALAWKQTDTFDNQNDYTVITKNLKGFVQGWANAEMLWFWVNAADLTADGMIDIRINNNYMPIGESWYTINSSGKAVRAGSIPKGYSTTTTIGRIPVKAGFQGWIGVETAIFKETKCVSSFKLHFYKNINKGDKVYFDEFWLTKKGQTPEYSASDLNFRTLRLVGSSAEIWKMSELYSKPTDADWAWLDKGNTKITSLVRGAAGTGYRDLYSLGYRANMTDAESKAAGGGHEYYNIRVRAADDVSLYRYTWNNPENKVLWFYMNASEVTAQNLYSDIRINGNKLVSGSHYYTLSKASSGRVSIRDMGELTTQTGMEYARLHVEAGFEGWIGIPMSAWSNPITIREFGFRILRALQKDQTVYLSDFWICNKGVAPDIDASALPAPLGDGAALLWNVDKAAAAAGKDVATIIADDTKNSASSAIDTAHAFGGSGKAVRYSLNEAVNGQSENVKIRASELKNDGFDNTVVMSDTDILWFWMYSDTSCEQLLHMEFNGKFLKEGSSLYIIGDNGGRPDAKEIPWEANAQTTVENPTVVPSAFSSNNTYARIKLPIGWSGFVGVPVSAFSANSKGEDTTSPAGTRPSEITFRLYNNQKAPSVGDSVYFDEFWLSSGDALPDLTDSELLYRYTAPAVTDGMVLDFERGWKENAQLDEKQTKPGRTRYWGYTVWSSGRKIENVTFTDAKSEGLDSGVSGTVLRWEIQDTWVGVGDGNITGLNKCAGGFVYLNLNKQWNALHDLTGYQAYTAYIDASKAENSLEIELRLIEDDPNGIGQQWQTYGPTGALSNITYYLETPGGQWKSTGSFQGRAIVPAGYTGRLLVEFDDMVHISEKDASSTGLYGSDEELQRQLVTHLGISIRGTKGDVAYVDNMAVLAEKVSTAERGFRLSSLYGDNMIFQQNEPFALQGFGKAGESVSASLLDGQTAVRSGSATVASDGTWKILMDPVAGSYTQYAVKVSSASGSDEIKGVVFGEVFFTGGQSNMQLRVHECRGMQELFAGNWKNSNIRIYRQQTVGDIALRELGRSDPDEPYGAWGTGSDWTDVYACTAIGYYFAAKLQSMIDMPVGVINSAVGGTGITSWIDPDVVSEGRYSALSGLIDSLGYRQESSGALNYLGNYFLTRVAPFDGYKVAGILWYQGEHDRANADLQTEGIMAVDESWSAVLRADESDTRLLPFVSMQVAPYATMESDAALTLHYNLNSRIAEGTAAIAAAGTPAVTVPTYDFDVIVDNIHPTNKAEVGERIARSVRAMLYDTSLTFSGPAVESAEYVAADNKIVIKFTNVGTGLVYRLPGSRTFDSDANASILPDDAGADKLNGFTVWTGLSFVNAEAKIVSADTVELTLPESSAGAAGIYYGYGERILVADLYNTDENGYSYPALPFFHELSGAVIPDHQIRIWDGGDAAGIASGTAAGAVTDNTSRSTVSGTVKDGAGIPDTDGNPTKAMAYTLTRVVTSGSNAQANTLTVNLNESIGANGGITPAAGDILWFWVDASISGPQTLFVYPNGLQTTLDSFYTIRNSNGTPEIRTVAKGSAFYGIGLEDHGNSGWQRFTLEPGASGWIGIPLDRISGAVGSQLSSLQIFTRSYSPLRQADGDEVYFDEFNVTSGGLMPDLTDSQLLYTHYVVTAYNKRVWDIDSLGAGAVLPSADNMPNRGSMNFSIEQKGILGSDAFAMTVAETSTNAGIINGTLNKENWTSSGVTGFTASRAVQDDDIFWVWLDNELGTDEYVVVEFDNAGVNIGGTPTAVDRSNVLYTITSGSGTAPSKKAIAPGETVGSFTNDNSSTRGAIKVENGGYGWIGIPLGDISGMSGKVVDGFRLYVRSISGDSNGTVGGSLYFDEFWITDGSLPELSDEALLFSRSEQQASAAYRERIWALDDLTGTVVYPALDTTRNRGSVELSLSPAGIGGSAAFTMTVTAASTNSGIINGTKNAENWVTSGVSEFVSSRAVSEGDVFWFWVDNELGEDEYVIAEFTGGSAKIGGTATAVNRTNVLYTIVKDGSGNAAIAVLAPGSTVGSITNDNSSTRAAIKVSDGGYGWIGIPLSDISGMTGNTLDGIRLYVRSITGNDNGTVGSSIYFDEFWVTSAGEMPELTDDQLLYTK